ncbi:MAG: tRNA uridine-5-carboxymethylaminomethyl(34) synthesis GTPase MnmE [Acetobacterales bacterium]
MNAEAGLDAGIRAAASTRQTIFALASGHGRSGVAVVRVSGPEAQRAARTLCGRLPEPRRLAVRRLRVPATGEALDEAMVVCFPGPGSFTGEDVVEFHLHGGRAVVEGVLEALGDLPDLRPALAGEFTRRAFDNGRLDLTEVEALADLVGAETSAQRRQALRQMSGALGRLYEGWTDALGRVLAHLEAAIDFPDEELPDALVTEAAREIKRLEKQIQQHMDSSVGGPRVRDGVSVAIVGAPNVGKSSLLNRIAMRDVAIVAETAGTTRDVLECHLDLGGYAVVIADLAGLRETDDPVEREGVRRALRRATEAELKLVVFDATAWPRLDASILRHTGEDSLVVLNKADRADLDMAPEIAGRAGWLVSATTGEGVDGLLDALAARIRALCDVPEAAPLTRARHRDALHETCGALARAGAAGQVDLMAEDVRLAVRALGRITGRVDVDDVLDRVFREFCIGK